MRSADSCMASRHRRARSSWDCSRVNTASGATIKRRYAPLATEFRFRSVSTVVPAHSAEPVHTPPTPEHARLAESPDAASPWRLWGPYLSGRQWGTVREDYSADGDAWTYLPFEHAHRRAYRWGEDGLGGFCDRYGFLNISLAMWNGRDPLLKERLFGLTNGEGNHGEDVKECYFYLDATPTHSYQMALYKYPQQEFPYNQLVDENRKRDKHEPEFEITDTGVFHENRYFDIIIEYAKSSPNDILIRITATNRGPEPATLHLLPTVWFRNTWVWGRNGEDFVSKPAIRHVGDGILAAEHASLGR